MNSKPSTAKPKDPSSTNKNIKPKRIKKRAAENPSTTTKN